MGGGRSTSVARTTLARAQRSAIRLAHRFAHPEPLGRGPKRGLVITGGGGIIGGILREGLAADYEIRSIDGIPRPGVDVVADVRRVAQMEGAFSGADAIVDLASDPSVHAAWRTVRDNNLAATVAVLEAARRVGVPRVVFASSNHVTGLYERDEPYASILAGHCDGLDPDTLPRLRAGSPIRPDGFYAVGKAAGEAAGRYYADEHGLSVICLRIGTVGRGDRPTNARQYATFISQRDLVQLVRRCIDAPPDLRFAVFYGASRNTWRIWDIEDSRSAIGYEPLDDAESFR
jgi:nucleoside-diphosphate-sugar epimerase